MIKRITHSPAETLHLGQKLAKRLRGGDILAISGELGAGKTVLIKGIAAGLGIKQTVRSPSFNLMKVYRIAKTLKHWNTKTQKQLNNLTRLPARQAIKQFAHLDCYRLKSPREAIDIGLLDYLEQPQTVVAIEWPERIRGLLKKYRLKKIKIRHLKENRRQITI